MTPEVSAVVVNHLSAAECADGVRSLREAFQREGIAGEILLVDCASGREEVSRLAGLEADVLIPLGENRGYSGGLNAGLARARGSRLLLCNADVVFLPGAVTGLLAAIADPAVGAAAPLATWDSEGRLLLPPGDPQGFLSELSRLLAGRWPSFDDGRFAGYARETLRLWQSGGAARHLIGAVLATRRDVFDRVGRFDERFLLEFEETEWEDRVRGAGLQLCFVARARIRHLWAVSSTRSREATARRDASRRVYRERRYGRLGRTVLERAGGSVRARGDGRPLANPELPARPGSWLALSPNPARFPFAAARLSEPFRLPDDVSARLPAGRWYFSVFQEADGRPLETYHWEKGS